jgi:cytochrome P450
MLFDWPVIQVVLGIFVLLTCAHALARRQLRHVPGPWLSKVCNLPLAFYDLQYRRNPKIHQLHRRHGPVVCIAPNEVSICAPESILDVYSSTLRWPKSDYFDHFMGYNERSVFATKSYEDHRAKRRLISSFYQPSTIYKVPEIQERVYECCRSVLRGIPHDREIDVYSLVDHYAFDVITWLALGPAYCSNTINSPSPERKILAGLKRQQVYGPFRIKYPFLYKLLGKILLTINRQWHSWSAEDDLASWCKKRVLAALDDPRTMSSHCLLRHLVTRSSGHKARPSEWITAEVLDNINAAEATVAVTTTYLIWRLSEATAVEWQEKIRDEVAALPLQADGSPSFADIDSKVPSLEACLREVYRLHPASSGRAERVVPKGGHVLSGVYIPEGTIVAASLAALQRQADIFPEPDRFRPQRWLDAAPERLKIQEAHSIPFGHGSRICLGKALATVEIKVIVANIYLRYTTMLGKSTTPESMTQCSTHDAVPKALACFIRFQGRHFASSNAAMARMDG